MGGFRDREGGDRGGGGNRECFNCHGVGHFARDCTKRNNTFIQQDNRGKADSEEDEIIAGTTEEEIEEENSIEETETVAIEETRIATTREETEIRKTGGGEVDPAVEGTTKTEEERIETMTIDLDQFLILNEFGLPTMV